MWCQSKLCTQDLKLWASSYANPRQSKKRKNITQKQQKQTSNKWQLEIHLPINWQQFLYSSWITGDSASKQSALLTAGSTTLLCNNMRLWIAQSYGLGSAHCICPSCTFMVSSQQEEVLRLLHLWTGWQDCRVRLPFQGRTYWWSLLPQSSWWLCKLELATGLSDRVESGSTVFRFHSRSVNGSSCDLTGLWIDISNWP